MTVRDRTAAIALGLAVLLTGLSPWPATSQDKEGWRLGVAAGVALHGEHDHLTPVGLDIQGTAAHPISSGVSAELGASVTYFPKDLDHVHLPCPPGEDTFTCHPTTSPAGFWRITGGMVLPLGSLRLSGGAGGYYQYLNEGRRSWEPGWYMGLGVPLGPEDTRFHLSARFHRLIGAPFTPDWYLPIGLEFGF